MSADDRLREMLAEEPLADDGFTRRITVSLARARRRRRRLAILSWAAAVAVVTVSIGVIKASMPDLGFPSALLSGEPLAFVPHAIALVVAAGVCGALWIDTEPLTL